MPFRLRNLLPVLLWRKNFRKRFGNVRFCPVATWKNNFNETYWGNLLKSKEQLFVLSNKLVTGRGSNLTWPHWPLEVVSYLKKRLIYHQFQMLALRAEKFIQKPLSLVHKINSVSILVVATTRYFLVFEILLTLHCLGAPSREREAGTTPGGGEWAGGADWKKSCQRRETLYFNQTTSHMTGQRFYFRAGGEKS